MLQLVVDNPANFETFPNVRDTSAAHGALYLVSSPPSRSAAQSQSGQDDGKRPHSGQVSGDEFDLTRNYREILHREEFVPSDSVIPQELTDDMRKWLRSYRDFLTDCFDL